MSSSAGFDRAKAAYRAALQEAKRAVAAAQAPGAGWLAAERAEDACLRAKRLQERVEELLTDREIAVTVKEIKTAAAEAAYEERRKRFANR
jgi:hypothetical protein